MTFGAWLKDRLIRVGMTQEQLADAMGASPSGVSRWVLDQRKPKPDQCHAIARALGIPADEVLRQAGWLIEAGSSGPAVQSGYGHSGGVGVASRAPMPIAGAVFVPVMLHVPATSKEWSGSMGGTEFQLLPPALVAGMGKPMIVVAGDDALSERGIRPGTQVVFDANARPAHSGDLVVVQIGDEIVLREWVVEREGYRLQASNEHFPVVYGRDEDGAAHIAIYGVIRAYGWWRQL